ncbi:MAG: hypothetical protein ACLP8Y_09575 [Thermoplasmata archaeon]
MDNQPAHRELLLPSPTKDPPEITPLVWSTSDEFWLEIQREKNGRVRYALGSIGALELDSMVSYLESTRPRLSGGGSIDCPAKTLVPEGLYARAVPTLKHHFLPLARHPGFDHADHLLRIFVSAPLQNHAVTLQTLFRSGGGWEATFFSPLFESVAARQDQVLRGVMRARFAEAAFHVEIRAHVSGPRPDDALAALGLWLSGWVTPGGTAWRRWRVVPPKKEVAFHQAMVDHCFHCFQSKTARRDVSGAELAALLSIPWSAHHPECVYSGAPRGRPAPELLVLPAATSRTPVEPRLFVGLCGSRQVALPRRLNHAAILGRTQSGKSTLALNLVLQILRKQPGATVVVIEPTGTLVTGVVSRLPREIATETVEIDPAHATFQQGDATKVSVPLSLLLPPERAGEATSVRDQWSEALAGNLLSAIRSAWGEESIGGRAELVLRAIVQGLALSPGSNLVDAYQILTSKPALQRFVKSASPGPLRDFLEHHLPRLDYNFTMSTLDKVGKIATNPLLRVALCQRGRSVSWDHLLSHRLLLLNLSKAALGADGANFLGAIYLTQLWAAIQRSGRADRPIYLILDEVHNYAVPALADMLSEGAKFGLHVEAITQYLHRVPPKIRAALLGNVDVWLLFSLGTEDMDDAWKIVNGESHGWTPQDLVDGLRPHEVAMATSGSLVKLETRPSPAPAANAADLEAAVVASSQRYAQPEDSEASPWLVDQDDLEAVLNGLSHRSRRLDELVGITSLRPDKLAAALRRSEEAGDIERDSDEPERVRLTPQGSVHLSALLARRNEGEDHVGTLVDLCMLLDSRGIAVVIPEQVAGVLTPDGQFRYGDAVYNVEVECSTVAKAADQVIRNVRKAREAGNRVLIALPDASSVPKLLAGLDSAFPGIRLWPDGVGVVWNDGNGVFHPHRVHGTEIWPFLEDGWKPEDEPSLSALDPTDQPILAATDPLPGLLRGIIQGFLRAGKTEATSSEMFAALPAAEQTRRTDEEVGVALSSLGLRHHRVRVDGTRPRVYELSAPRTSNGPGARTGSPTSPERDPLGPGRWSGDSPSGNN